ncbi:MAG: TIGR02281 family clan AA aspartic protease [Paracoccaceae bacterium]
MTEDALLRLVYLSVLGAAILAGVFAAYRGRMATGIQHALVWVLIILGLVAVYGLREDLMAALLPGATVERQGDALVLRRAADGHFHLNAEVNGAPVEFLVDTGASDLVLSRRDAQSAGIDPDEIAYTRRAMTANGQVSIAPVRLERVEIAGIEARDVPAVVGSEGLFGSLMGMSYLDRWSRVTVEGDRMTLEP